MLNRGFAKDLSVEEFRRFRDLIHRHSGIYLEESKLDSLRISLVARLTRLGYATFSEYYDALGRDEQELNELLNLITINETSFFRFPAQFDALRNIVAPEIAGRKSGSRSDLRVWSAGCSTGEEPYSIAITLLEAGLDLVGWKPHVLGTDVSTRALATAKTGIYSERAMINVPRHVVDRYFDRTASGDYRVNEQVRKMVDFGYQNLVKEPYPLSIMGNWDIIFCRNVTIYFQIDSTKRVVSNFYDSLNEGGYLFIGHSETLAGINEDFEPVEVGGVFLYRKPEKARVRVRGFVAPHAGISSHRGDEHRSRARRKPVFKTDEDRRGEGVRADRPNRSQALASGDGKTGDVAATLERARRDLSEGHPERVREVVSRVLEIDPNNAEAHLMLAYVHADIGDYEEALAACHRALAINPLLPAARYILGIIYQRRGDSVRAISELKKTVYIDADFALAHLNLANIYKAQRRFDAAAKEYTNALKALNKSPNGDWTEYSGGFQADLLIQTCERSLIECRKAAGTA